MQAIKWALQSKCKIWIISPTYNQCIKFFKDISQPLIKAGLTTKALQSQNGILLEFINGSTIEFKSGAAKDALRGSTLDYIILDEADFIDEEIFNKVLLPMIITKPKAKVLILSTPRGKRLMFKYFNIKSPKHYSIKITYRDNPYVSMDIINDFKSAMPEEMFNQEFEAKFVDSANVFSNINELSTLKLNPDYKGKVWLGIDIGLVSDNTCITAVNEKGQMVWFDRFTGLEAPALKERILSAFNKFNVVKGLIESNGLGLPIYQDLKVILSSKIEPFITTNTSKGDIINNLIFLFSKKEIRIIYDDGLITELESFIFKFSKSGKVQYEAASGFKDDSVMSLAIAIECKNKYANTTPAIKFLKKHN